MHTRLLLLDTTAPSTSDMYCGATGGESIKINVEIGAHATCKSYPPTASGQIKCKWVLLSAPQCGATANSGGDEVKTTLGSKISNTVIRCDTPDWGFNEDFDALLAAVSYNGGATYDSSNSGLMRDRGG